MAKLRLDDDPPYTDRAKVKDWINGAYFQATVETGANVVNATMALTADTNSYTLPTDVSRIVEMYVIPVSQPQWAPLEQVSLHRMLQWRQGGQAAATTGSVTHYCLVGLSEFEVWPTPTTADTIKIYYVQLPTPLSDDGDLPILPEPYASKLLEYGALAEGADYRSDPSEFEYRQLYEGWIAKFKSHLARKHGEGPGQLEIYGRYQLVPHDPSTDLRGVTG